MIIEQMSISASDGGAAELCSVLASLTGPTEVQPGCLSCQIYQSWNDPNQVFLLAKWANAGDLIAHLQSDIYKRLLLLIELAPNPPVLQFYMVREVHGLELVEQARLTH